MARFRCNAPNRASGPRVATAISATLKLERPDPPCCVPLFCCWFLSRYWSGDVTTRTSPAGVERISAVLSARPSESAATASSATAGP